MTLQPTTQQAQLEVQPPLDPLRDAKITAWLCGWFDCARDRRPDPDGCPLYWSGYRTALMPKGF
jgi:hypothetical protein